AGGGSGSSTAQFDNLSYPPVPAPPPPPPEIEEPPTAPVGYLNLADRFTDGVIDTNRFSASDGITESGGRLHIPSGTGSFLSFSSLATNLNLVGRATAVEVPQVASTGSTYFIVYYQDQN